MDEPPAQALRYKKDSSMRVAVNLVKSGEAHACVSAGNTGALMAISRFVLKTLDGIDRPAIATVLPNMKRTNTYVLDLGANVDCTAEHLLQFGIMGAMLVAAVEHKERPTVGLLNIGTEDIKGNEAVKQAAEPAARQRPQLHRQRRRQRHLQGHRRRGGVRRFRRQRGAESFRGRGGDAHHHHARGVFAQRAHQDRRLWSPCRCCVRSATARPPALQRRQPARAARHRHQEPWLGRRVRLRPGARARGGRGAQQRAAAHRRAHGAAAAAGVQHQRSPRSNDLLAHRRHRQLSAGAGGDQRRVRRAPRHERCLDPRAHRHRAAPHRGRIAGVERPRAAGEQAALCRQPASPRISWT